MTTVFDSPDALLDAVGRELGSSEWIIIEQDRIDGFADATGDHQWIHVDPEAAVAGPFQRRSPTSHPQADQSVPPRNRARRQCVDGNQLRRQQGAAPAAGRRRFAGGHAALRRQKRSTAGSKRSSPSRLKSTAATSRRASSSRSVVSSAECASRQRFLLGERPKLAIMAKRKKNRLPADAQPSLPRSPWSPLTDAPRSR